MALTPDDFLALLRRTTDASWLEGMLADANGDAVLSALFAVASAVDLSVELGCAAGLAQSASGGVPGSAILTLSRIDATNSIDLPKGYAFRTRSGTLLLLVLDITVAVAQTAIVLPLVTARSSEVLNTVDGAFAYLAVGAASDAIVDVGSPVILDSGGNVAIGPPGSDSGLNAFLTYSDSTPVVGSASDWLSAHGDERGQRRQPNEPTDAYRRRVLNVPDAVSPRALAEGVQGAASTNDLPFLAMLEPFEDGASAALKGNLGLGSFGTVYASGIEAATPSARPLGTHDVSAGSPARDFLDDSGVDPDDPGARPRELVGLRESRAYFRLDAPPPIEDPDDSRMFYSGTEDPASPPGRPPGARDAAATSPKRDFWDDEVLGYPDVHDHPRVIAALMSVWEEANRKRAAGVGFDLYLDVVERQIGVGASLLAAETIVWTLVPPAGIAWWLRDARADHDANPVDVASMWHRIKFTFEDATTFTTPMFQDVWSERLDVTALLRMGFPFKRIVQIDGIARSDGVDLLNVVGTFFVLPASIV